MRVISSLALRLASAPKCSAIFYPPRRMITVSSSRATMRTTVSPLETLQENPVAPSSVNPAVVEIVDKIERMTLLEVSELTKLLKERLNIADLVMPVAASAGPAAKVTDEGDSAESSAEDNKPVIKTNFKVIVKEFPTTAKVKLIKEIKTLNPTMSLVAAKQQVENLPFVVRDGLSTEEAETLKKQLESTGAILSIE